MDNQTLYNEVMAKLAEAQNCQNEIINCNNELQKMYSKRDYDRLSYYRLIEQSQEVVGRQNDWISERDKKVNDAISDALDIADDEMDKNTFNPNSIGSQALVDICVFMVSNNIRVRYSAEVEMKLANVQAKFVKVAAEGLGLFPFNIGLFGW